MRTRRLTAYESHVINKHLNEDAAAQKNYSSGAVRKIFSSEQMRRALNAERTEQLNKATAAMKDDAAYFTSEEFREEVIAAIIEDGATRLQAEGRTRDQVRLFNEARELGLM